MCLSECFLNEERKKNMKLHNPFSLLTRFELILWLGSMALVTLSFLLLPTSDYLTLAASLIGATALIFVAKGHVFGQALTVVFAVFYGIISYWFKYYGEMITYLLMTSPIAVMSVVAWLRHPFENSREVEVSRMNKRQASLMLLFTALATILFYFILKALGNANLLFSTISIATSFLASYLTLMRSPYYALAYAANDIVLIVLWIMATLEDSSYAPMVVCFLMFLVNDSYGFLNWQRMKQRQEKGL